MQACSQEERRRDFEKIFAHYDVVSHMNQFILLWSVNDRFIMCCWDFFLLLGAAGLTEEWQLCPSPWPMSPDARLEGVKYRQGGAMLRGLVSRPFDFLHCHSQWCCISSFPAGDAREAEEVAALVLTVSGSSGPAPPPRWKISPFRYQTHGCSGSLAQDRHNHLNAS